MADESVDMDTFEGDYREACQRNRKLWSQMGPPDRIAFQLNRIKSLGDVEKPWNQPIESPAWEAFKRSMQAYIEELRKHGL
jgi:hypothetical protein